MRLALIATGGTIAGSGPQQSYSAGVLSAETLFAAVPRLAELADWHIEQPFALDSRDLTPEHWLQLAACIQTQLDAPDIAGVVLTHGTDTLEETAFALHWLLPTGKPVVLTAAMRPASSLSPDGPQNLLQAACVALSPQARNQGVLVVANDAVIAARHVAKAHTHAPGALQSRAGLLGSIAGEQPLLPPAPCPPRPALLPIPARTALPRVDILHAHAGANPDLLDACVAAGAAGIVLALAGHGSIPAVWRPAIARARTRGCHILRASLIQQGGVWPQSNEDDSATGCIAAGSCSAVQARALLLLALANQPGIEREALVRLFANCL